MAFTIRKVSNGNVSFDNGVTDGEGLTGGPVIITSAAQLYSELVENIFYKTI